MAATSGTILEALEHAKAKFPNDLETQAKYLLLCVNQLKEHYGDDIRSIQAPYMHYNVILTGIPIDGNVCFVWELYSGAMQEGVGLEYWIPNTNKVSLLFSSNSLITKPILPALLNQ